MKNETKETAIYPAGSEAEAIDLYRQMKEAELAERERPKKALTPEELNAAFERMKDMPPEEAMNREAFNPVSLLLLGSSGDEVGGVRKKSHIQLRSELMAHPAFNDYGSLHLLYEELLERKEGGERLRHEEVTGDDWKRLWYVEGIDSRSLCELFEASPIEVMASRDSKWRGDGERDYRLGYLRMKTERFKQEFSNLTASHQSNYSLF